MADLFWCRRVRLTLGSNEEPNSAMMFGSDQHCNHRIDFRVTKTRDSSKNKGVINIYNLSLDERNIIDEDYDRILLNVGYQGDYPLDAKSGFWSDIVDGWVHKVTHEQRGNDIVTDIEYIEAKPEHNLSKVNFTADGGTTYISIVKKIVERSMSSIAIGDISGISPNSTVTKGRARTFSGQAMEVVAEIAQNHDARATIDGNTLYIISNDKGVEDSGGIPLFSAETGLIGRASKTEKGVNFTTFLHPHIRPNRFVAVRDDLLSGGANRNRITTDAEAKTDKAKEARIAENYVKGAGGVYRVNKVVFSGSNRGRRFACNIEGQTSDGFKVKRDALGRSPVAKVIRGQEIENE